MLGGNVGIVGIDKLSLWYERENESRKRRQLLIADSRRWIVGHFKNGNQLSSQSHAFWRKIQVNLSIGVIRNCRLCITKCNKTLIHFLHFFVIGLFGVFHKR